MAALLAGAVPLAVLAPRALAGRPPVSWWFTAAFALLGLAVFRYGLSRPWHTLDVTTEGLLLQGGPFRRWIPWEEVAQVRREPLEGSHPPLETLTVETRTGRRATLLLTPAQAEWWQGALALPRPATRRAPQRNWITRATIAACLLGTTSLAALPLTLLTSPRPVEHWPPGSRQAARAAAQAAAQAAAEAAWSAALLPLAPLLGLLTLGAALLGLNLLEMLRPPPPRSRDRTPAGTSPAPRTTISLGLAPAAAGSPDEALRCPFCHDTLDAEAERTPCTGCGTAYHEDCYAEHGGCVVIGCRQRPHGVRRRL